MKKLIPILIVAIFVTSAQAFDNSTYEMLKTNTITDIKIPVPEKLTTNKKTEPTIKTKALNKLGNIKGGINGAPANIIIDKMQWTIKGGLNGSPINIKINHKEKTLTGGANHNLVKLSFEWSPKEVSFKGGANASPVNYKVNWKKGVLEGYSNHAPLKISFDMKEGQAGENTVELKGYANNSLIDLKFNKISGELTGGMNKKLVKLNLTNCDLYDFLQYIFLFIK